MLAGVSTRCHARTGDRVGADVDALARSTSKSRRASARSDGRIFEAFPDPPDDPGASGVPNLRASLERARDTGDPDVMPLRYPDGGRRGLR
jgi:hypothetical protein